MKAILEITDEQLLEVVAFVKERGIAAVFEGAFLLEVGKKYKNRKGKVVRIEGEEYGQFRGGKHLYYANGRYWNYESELDLIEEVKEKLPFEMVVGGVYEMSNGGIEEIVEDDFNDVYPFLGKSGESYTEKGFYSSNQSSRYDLIKRIR